MFLQPHLVPPTEQIVFISHARCSARSSALARNSKRTKVWLSHSRTQLYYV